MQADSIFLIMSMTKNFTGVAAMMLVEQGKLELRQPIERYLPEYRGIQMQDGQSMHAPNNAPTVWQLMDHTSGWGTIPRGRWQTIHGHCACLSRMPCTSMRTRACNSFG